MTIKSVWLLCIYFFLLNLESFWLTFFVTLDINIIDKINISIPIRPQMAFVSSWTTIVGHLRPWLQLTTLVVYPMLISSFFFYFYFQPKMNWLLFFTLDQVQLKLRDGSFQVKNFPCQIICLLSLFYNRPTSRKYILNNSACVSSFRLHHCQLGMICL